MTEPETVGQRIARKLWHSCFIHAADALGAAALIDAELAQERDAWVSVSVLDKQHGLPEENKVILFFRADGRGIEMGYWRGRSSPREERWQSVETAPQDEPIYFSDEQVTHWRELPAPPVCGS